MTTTLSDTSTAWEEFPGILKDLSAVAADITRVEKAKAEAASNNKHAAMDGFLREEQALLLKLRGLEQHRMQLQEKLGWKDLKFRQILEKADEGQKEALLPLFHELEEQVRELVSAQESAKKMINVKIHEFQNILSGMEGQSYDGSGNTPEAPAVHFHDSYV